MVTETTISLTWLKRSLKLDVQGQGGGWILDVDGQGGWGVLKIISYKYSYFKISVNVRILRLYESLDRFYESLYLMFQWG